MATGSEFLRLHVNICTQLDDLRSMKDGWLDGDGIAPPKDGLDWLDTQFKRFYPDSAPRPHMYPTFEGGVEVEWSLKPYEIGITIDLSEHSGEWYWINMSDDDDYDERDLDLDDRGDWAWVVDELQRLSGDYK